MTTASEKTSNDPASSDHVLQRLEALADQWAEECKPSETWIYYLRDEEEASQILLAMAATIKHLTRDVDSTEDRKTMKKVASGYRRAVKHGKALETFRNMTEEDQLEIYGITLKAGAIIPVPA